MCSNMEVAVDRAARWNKKIEALVQSLFGCRTIPQENKSEPASKLREATIDAELNKDFGEFDVVD